MLCTLTLPLSQREREIIAPGSDTIKSAVESSTSLLIKCRASWISRRVAKFFLDSDQLIVFRNAIAARSRSRLNLPGVGRDREIGYERIFSLPRPMRDDRRATV